MNKSIYYINGAFVPAPEARLPATDLAITRGYGVFDFMRTYGGEVFQLDAHLERLARSAALILLDLPWTHDALRRVVMDTLTRSTHAESGIKIIVTGGDGDGFTGPQYPRLLVLVDAMYGYPAHYYTKGVSAITVPVTRDLAEAKSINYIPAIVAMRRAQAQGANEALYTTPQTQVIEATRANLFAFFGDTLVTPGEGILPGITRALVMQLAEARFEVVARAITVEELLTAGEVFITSTSKEIMPVTQVNSLPIGDGAPGACTRILMEAFRTFAEANRA